MMLTAPTRNVVIVGLEHGLDLDGVHPGELLGQREDVPHRHGAPRRLGGSPRRRVNSAAVSERVGLSSVMVGPQ